MTASFRERAHQYADDVVGGKIPAGQYVKMACRRFLNDLTRQDIVLTDQAERWCKFLEKLPHVKGRWGSKGQRFILSEWQIFVVVNIYGWRWANTEKRRFRDVYIEVPRKNGKSFLMAGLGLGHLTIDGEFGAEIYCGATTEKQAWEVFRPAHQMAERTPELCEWAGLQPHARSLTVEATGSRFEPVIGKPGDGASPSCAIADEFHEHQTSDLVDTFTTGMGAREQPVMLHITTAGNDMGGPCYQKRVDTISILDGASNDDSMFGMIYTVDPDMPWDTTEALVMANPNYGISVDKDFLEGRLAEARRSATKQAAYKTKHLNLWVGAKQAWMNMLAYQARRRKGLRLEDMKGRRCYVGLDLASKTDVAEAAFLFPPASPGDQWVAFCKHYLPEDYINNAGNTRYAAWHAEGWITSTPGNIIDFEYIEDDLRAIKSHYELIEVPYDPFQATQFAVHLAADGFPMVEYGATVRNFSEPMKHLEAMILDKQIEFSMDPVLMWMFGNVVAKRDKKDNIFPDKEVPGNKIDGVVALLMALGRAMVREQPDTFTGEIRTVDFSS